MKNKFHIVGAAAYVDVGRDSQEVVVDSEAMDLLSGCSIHVRSIRQSDSYEYLQVAVYSPKDKREFSLPSFLFPECPSGLVRDHINGDTLDNRSSNIRFATRSENAKNNWRRRAGHKIFESPISQVFSFRVPRSEWDYFNSLVGSEGKYETIRNALERARYAKEHNALYHN